MRELNDELAADEELAAAYARAHEAYLADRAGFGDVDEIEGISAGGMPTRVKCLHALAGHALAAGPGVNPIGDRALAMSRGRRRWSARPRSRRARTRWAPPERSGALATAARDRRRMRRRLIAAALAAVIVGATVAAPAMAADAATDEDPVRAAEYWLDDYGITEGLADDARRGRPHRDHRHRHRPRTRRVLGRGRGRHGRLRCRQRRRAHPGRRGRCQSRQLGGLARRGPGDRPGHRHDRRGARGGAAVGLGRLRDVLDACRSRIRSPRRSAGRSTTAPTSSTCRSRRTHPTGTRAGTTRSCTRSTTTSSSSSPPATAAAARRASARRRRSPAC